MSLRLLIVRIIVLILTCIKNGGTANEPVKVKYEALEIVDKSPVSIKLNINLTYLEAELSNS